MANINYHTIILLIIVGALVYFLLNTDMLGVKKDLFTNTNSTEPMTESYSAPIMSSAPTMSSAPIMSSAPMSTNGSSQSAPAHLNFGRQPLTEESDINYDYTEPQDNMPAPFDYSNIPDQSISYQPNDESGYDDASPLGMAFTSPLAPGSSSDVVDFKKGNVDNYNAKDFLPNEINDEWFETDFSLAKYQLNDDKLINTDRYIIGINTVGSSLKNGSYDLRGTIANPKFNVSPWNNSTYEPDFNIKPWC